MNDNLSDDNKSKVLHQFGASADLYATSDIHAKGESLSALFNLVKPQSDWKCLDVATGAGHTALTFAPYVQDILATDITPEMLSAVEKLSSEKNINNIKTQIADAETLPFPDHTFDLILCRLAFHHFPKPQQVLSEFSRVLKPNGRLGFTDNFTVENKTAGEYYNQYEKLRDPSHHEVHSLSRLMEMLKEAGFINIESKIMKKEFEFHEWADRQHASEKDKKQLIHLMKHIPEQLNELFEPRWTQKTFYFKLWEIALTAEVS